jgi:ketosteroid isomerase-like protein
MINRSRLDRASFRSRRERIQGALVGESEMGKQNEPRNANSVHEESREAYSPKSVALKFVEIINAGDSEALMRLQTDDFTLIDMAGDVTRGRDGWPSYFASFPEYKIHVQQVLTSGNGVAIIGKTTGSHVPPEVEEKETVLWTAEIQDGLVAEWRIYSDIAEAMQRAQESQQAD